MSDRMRVSGCNSSSHATYCRENFGKKSDKNLPLKYWLSGEILLVVYRVRYVVLCLLGHVCDSRKCRGLHSIVAVTSWFALSEYKPVSFKSLSIRWTSSVISPVDR